MALVFIALGSNMGDGRANLQVAWQRLKACAGITPISLSSPYITEPVGMESAQWFTNAVGAVETSLAPEALLICLLDLEKAMGRDRSKGKDRIIDLDILYYDDLIYHSATLDLPHPEMVDRLFVLAPLAELAPDHLHPVTTQSNRQMLRSLRHGEQKIKHITWGN